ncbi:unnamed protein product [Periconia digitata]|uniref:Secreted protein n=1 Tax=Periconia digitata TaxID=1303443 RepID=A0A9W4XV64_9PLEO|nr:unnamed protein product [Periconia digitata]
MSEHLPFSSWFSLFCLSRASWLEGYYTSLQSISINCDLQSMRRQCIADDLLCIRYERVCKRRRIRRARSTPSWDTVNGDKLEGVIE